MQNFQVCYDLAKSDQSELTMMVLVSRAVIVNKEEVSALATVNACKLTANSGICTFMLRPPGLKGEALFAHMIKYREMHSSSKVSHHLGIEMSAENENVLASTSKALAGENLSI